MRIPKTALWLASLAPLAAPSVLGQTDAPPAQEPHRKGYFEAVFTERHPESAIEKQGKRSDWKMSFVRANDEKGGQYDLADESFQVWVPDSYSPEEPHGLLVWVSPADDGGVPAAWVETLEKHDLLFIGAHRSGNERYVWYRMGLALDAVHNMKQLYSIDEERVYVTGFSGGGRLANRLGVLYADVFHGGIYQGGAAHYAKVQNPDDRTSHWPARMPRPKGASARHAKKRSRHVYFVGSEDFNRKQSRAIYDLVAKKERFAHATWLEAPDLGHRPAPAEWLDRAIEALDSPLLEERRKAAEREKRSAEGEDDGR